MALNTERVGHVYDPITYEVSREKIREYAAAVGETDQRYFSDGDDCVAPPTFAACFTITETADVLLGDDELGGHLNLVHGTQSYRYGTRPLRPGDVVTVTPRVADIAARRANEFLTLELDCRFADSDELAVASTTVLVLLGSAPGASDEASDGAADGGGA